MNKRFGVQSPFIPKFVWCLGLIIKNTIIKIERHKLKFYNKRKKKEKKKQKLIEPQSLLTPWRLRIDLEERRWNLRMKGNRGRIKWSQCWSKSQTWGKLQIASKRTWFLNELSSSQRFQGLMKVFVKSNLKKNLKKPIKCMSNVDLDF